MSVAPDMSACQSRASQDALVRCTGEIARVLYTVTGGCLSQSSSEGCIQLTKLVEKGEMHAQSQRPTCSVPSVAHVSRKNAPPTIMTERAPRLISAKRRRMEACIAGLAEAAHQHAAAQAGPERASGNRPVMVLHLQCRSRRPRPHPDQALGAAVGVRVSWEASSSPFWVSF